MDFSRQENFNMFNKTECLMDYPLFWCIVMFSCSSWE